MDRVTRAFEVRALEEPGQFSGYASVFGVVDSHGTVFDRGAFKKTIKEHSGQLPIVWMHDAYSPIGLATVREDEKGLWVDGVLDLDVQKGREVYSGMKKGYITQMSHSFASVKETSVRDEDNDIIHYKEVRSFEVSPTTANFASNKEAEIVSVRTSLMESVDEAEAALARLRELATETEEDEETYDELRGMIERITALLEPSEDTRTEPHDQPDNHWEAFTEEMQRVQTLLGGNHGR